MSADPDSSASPEPAPSPPFTGSKREKMPIPQAKRRYRRDSSTDSAAAGAAPAARRAGTDGSTIEPGKAPSEDQELEAEIENLNARLRALAARKIKPPPSAEAEARGAKYYRLVRKSAAPSAPRDPNTPTAEPAAEPLAALPTEPAAEATPLEAVPPLKPRTAEGRSTGPHDMGWLATDWHPRWWLGAAGILMLGGLVFWLGRLSVKPTTVRKEVPLALAPTWSPADIDQLDKVLTADASGNILTAYSLATGLRDRLDTRPDLERYISGLKARRGSLNDAEVELIRLSTPYAPPLVTAAVQYRLGFVYARRRDFKAADECFADAAAADPFNPWPYYYWGESLRREGQLAEAVVKFQKVLLRLPMALAEDNSLRQCAAFRLRLSLIELGNDAEVKTAIEEQLRLPVPSVYWLLTALAYDLQHNDLPGAASNLQRVKVVAPPALLDALFNDYYLHTLATHSKEVSAFIPEMTAARRRQLDASLAYFIDP